MAGLIRLLAALALGLTLTAAPVAAQDININPVPPKLRIKWTPVPNASGVYWAPNLPTDVFRHGGKYYFYWEGYLYRGSNPKGPWKTVTKVPAWFAQIDPSYFKTGRKEPTPPGGLPPLPPEGLPEGLPPAPPAPPEAVPPPAPEPTPSPGKPPGAPVIPPEPVNPPKVM